MAGDRFRLMAGAIGDITEGTGRFRGMQGNVTFCGEITARGELRGHIIIRVLDESGVFVRDDAVAPSGGGRDLEGDLTFFAWVGQKDPNDAIENHFSIDSNGNPRGMNIATNLKHGSVFSALRGGRLQASRLRVANKIGQEIGFGRPSDPNAPPRGTPKRPFPFEGVARYSLFQAPGAASSECGALTTNVLVGGRVDVNFPGAPEEPGLRFGFFGPILYGDGCFRGAGGMFYGASASIFKLPPAQHVVTHFYAAVLIDPEHRFRR